VNARGIVSYLDDANRVLSSLLAHDFRRRRHLLDFPCAIRLPQIIDNFESYGLGLLPSPTWLDAGAVLPIGRIPPFPSAYVISTLDAFGNPHYGRLGDAAHFWPQRRRQLGVHTPTRHLRLLAHPWVAVIQQQPIGVHRP